MANVAFRRGDNAYVNAIAVTDGQILFDTQSHAIYMDNGSSRDRYGGGNLSKSDVDTALSANSTNPVQNKVIYANVLKKTDVINTLSSAIAVTNTQVPVGCGVAKDLNNKIGQLTYSNAGAHNSIFRGKNLGTSVSSAQSTAIQNGTFDDMYVGDFWVINGRTWRIAGFDIQYNCGDTPMGHCVCIVPDDNIFNGTGNNTTYAMNTTDTTSGGYVGSQMYNSIIPNKVVPILQSAFGSHLITTYRALLSNSVNGNNPNNLIWVTVTACLMNEVMLYGSNIASTHDLYFNKFNIGADNVQLPLFRLAPQFIHIRNNYWLRDVVSSGDFALCDIGGRSDCTGASSANVGVRPFFLIH